ncbi:MAG: adenosylcobinamide-phosphate synthase CbiB [Pseudomonadota bacterium]
MADAAMLMAAAWLLEVLVGWPQGLTRRIGHPVIWVGTLINSLEQLAGPGSGTVFQQRLAGVLTVLATIATAVITVQLIIALAHSVGLAFALEVVIAASLLASRSLDTHVRAVAQALETQGLEAGRTAVAQIVGRDVAALEADGVSRAAIESLAENASDGVVAPLFWGVLLGLPGLVAYKAINTLDSMIGHRSPRYQYYGTAAARLDDFANLVPARLTGWLFVLVAAQPSACASVMRRDAPNHRSPNAGWPEAAAAAALGIALGGPRRYGTDEVAAVWLNQAGRAASPPDIHSALQLYRRALVLLAAVLLLIGLLAAAVGS